MTRTLVQGIVGLIMAAIATWATQKLVEAMFGADDGSVEA